MATDTKKRTKGQPARVSTPKGVNTQLAGWLLFFYSVPSRPVRLRMQVWRRLMRLGALQLKGAVYVLPSTDEHIEGLRWLVAEVTGMGGEAGFVQTNSIEPMKDVELHALFHKARAEDYREMDTALSALERKAHALGKGGKGAKPGALLAELDKLRTMHEGIRRLDYFGSEAGTSLGRRIAALAKGLSQMPESGPRQKPEHIARRKAQDYRGRLWVTRTSPFVDRMASAWLIKHYIDPEASFGFVMEKAEEAGADAVTYDMAGADFTHVGSLCSFEVLMRAFGLTGNRALTRMARLVHELDMKDARYDVPEARGVEEILTGIRKSSTSDAEALERGMKVFEMLHATQT